LNELKFKDTSRDTRCFEDYYRSSAEQDGDEDLEIRFVRIVAVAVAAATVDTNSRFLNQGQRCSLNLLRAMASDGSMDAFKELVALAGNAFFVKWANDSDVGDRDCDEAGPPGISLVASEAATILLDEVAKESARNACKAMVLYSVLEAFLKEFEEDHTRKRYSTRYYKRMVPVVTHGLNAVANLGEKDLANTVTELVWASLVAVFSKMLSPVPIENDLVKISRVGEIVEMLEAARDYVPPNNRSDLSTILSLGATKCLEIAKQHDEFAKNHYGSDEGKQSEAHRDDILKMFGFCFSACCSIEPENALLRSTAEQVLEDASAVNGSSTEADDELQFADEIAVIICQSICQNEEMKEMVVSIFSLLCKLVASKKASVREAAARVLSVVDIPEILKESRNKYEDAERRAELAEKRVAELSVTVDELERKNETLRSEVAVLEASSAM